VVPAYVFDLCAAVFDRVEWVEVLQFELMNLCVGLVVRTTRGTHTETTTNDADSNYVVRSEKRRLSSSINHADLLDYSIS
jgi:hypothetical protein